MKITYTSLNTPVTLRDGSVVATWTVKEYRNSEAPTHAFDCHIQDVVDREGINRRLYLAPNGRKGVNLLPREALEHRETPTDVVWHGKIKVHNSNGLIKFADEDE